jgi:hypothetical protein
MLFPGELRQWYFFPLQETLTQSAKSTACHVERRETSRISSRLESRDSSATPQNDIAAQSLPGGIKQKNHERLDYR